MTPATDAPSGFFEVLRLPRAYTTLAYLLLSLATGILAFTFVVTGLSLSLGLAILIIGLPVALAFLLGVRLLALGEAYLLRTLVGEPALPLPLPPPLPQGLGFLARLGALLRDRRTWTSLLYFLLRMPLGILGFTLMVTLLAVGLSLAAIPVAAVLQALGLVQADFSGLCLSVSHPQLTVIACGLVASTLLPATLHLGLALGRLQGWLAGHLLVQS